MVVMEHLRLSGNNWYAFLFQGGLGVNIFFVLSGFLITTLCLRELSITGTISLTKFYIRRALRIFPVAYLYIFIILLMCLFLRLKIAPTQFLGASLYLMNFSYFRSHDFSWFFGHFWSLSVEEQFYLIFPFLIKRNIRLFKYSILLIVFALPLLCTAQYIWPSLDKGFLYLFSHYFIKFQSIAIGCLFAILANGNRLDKRFVNSYNNWGAILCLIIIFVLHYDTFYSIEAVYKNLGISVTTGFLIILSMFPKTLLYKILNNKLLSKIGVLSYSIYIWQQIFTAGTESPVTTIATPPVNILLIIIVPILSYNLFEKYFLRLKYKYSIGKN